MAHSPIPFAEKKSPKRLERVPSPDEIRSRAAEIRRSWSPEERRQREVSIPGWSLLPIIIGSDRLSAASRAGDDRTQRGRVGDRHA